MLKDDFSFALRLLFFITVPSMVGLIALRLPIVNTLFQHGEFSQAAAMATAEALMYYSFGIWAIVGVRTVTATFYSMQDTKTPVKIAVCGVATNIIFSLILMGPMLHSGLALANSIAATVNFILLFFFLRRKLGGIGTRRIMTSFAKTGAAALLMGLFGALLTGGAVWDAGGNTGAKAMMLAALITGSAGVYLIAAWLFRSEEMEYLITKVREKLKKDQI
jgi:putative peptidoglycan lipid II flippase